MPEKKNQHFVPRAYLKNFSRDGRGKTISLYNFNRGLLVSSAPTKSQCSRPYFHGRDELEDILADVEGRYAEWISRNLLEEWTVVSDLSLFLQFLFALQYMRTEHSIIRMQSMFELQQRMMNLTTDEQAQGKFRLPTQTEMVRASVLDSLKFKDHISDLKLALVKNSSNVPFVTSDDPVCFTNRLFLQRLRRDSFGWGSAGAIFYCPFSPRVGGILYDSDVYAADKNGKYWIEVTNDKDSRSLNELVFLKARENIYFKEPSDFDLEHFKAARPNRLDRYVFGSILKKVGTDSGGELYQRTDDVVVPRDGGEHIISQTVVHPSPSTWFSKIKFRSSIVAYSNGSAAGFVRRHTAELENLQVPRIRL